MRNIAGDSDTQRTIRFLRDGPPSRWTWFLSFIRPANQWEQPPHVYNRNGTREAAAAAAAAALGVSFHLGRGVGKERPRPSADHSLGSPLKARM